MLLTSNQRFHALDPVGPHGTESSASVRWCGDGAYPFRQTLGWSGRAEGLCVQPPGHEPNGCVGRPICPSQTPTRSDGTDSTNKVRGKPSAVVLFAVPIQSCAVSPAPQCPLFLPYRCPGCARQVLPLSCVVHPQGHLCQFAESRVTAAGTIPANTNPRRGVSMHRLPGRHFSLAPIPPYGLSPAPDRPP